MVKKKKELMQKEDLHLDLMRDPWLKVLWLDGTVKDESLYTVITKAELIRKIIPAGTYSLTEYVLMSFIIDFVQWVYKPAAGTEKKAERVILDMYEKGKFDSSVLDEYIDMYENKLHRSFDIFDEEHPFLQSSKTEKEKMIETAMKKSNPNDYVKNLSFSGFGIEYSSGNNVLFEHRRNAITYEQYMERTEGGTIDIPIDQLYRFSPQETVTALIFSLGYAQASGGYGSVSTAGKFNLHPIFVINEGENLFTTICASIGTAKKYRYAPVWEQPNYLVKAADAVTGSEKDGNHISLTYVSLSNTSLLNYSFAMRIPFSAQDFGGSDNLPKMIYPAWVSCMPRVIKVDETDKKGHAVTRTMNYQSPVIMKDDKKGNNRCELETELIQLAYNGNKCDIIARNYKVLKEKTKLSPKFYCWTKSTKGSGTIPELSRIIEWPENLTFISDTVGKKMVSEALETVKELSILTAYWLTVATGLATGACKEENGVYKIAGKSITSYKNQAETDTVWTGKKCQWFLQRKYYEKLESGDYSCMKEIKNEIYESFKSVFKTDINRITRLSAIDRVKIKDIWQHKAGVIINGAIQENKEKNGKQRSKKCK